MQKNRTDTEQMKSFIQNPKALIVAPPWAGLIVTGEKDWEMRSRATSTRGIIAIAEKGAKRLLGLVTLDRCSGPHTQTALLQNINHHRGTTEDIMQPGFKYHYAWELSNAIEFPAPIPYTPKSGQ